ncbi:ent-kaurene synthase [Xylaria palmicola]|nr:ent-kaurene synthase [Xylaria palmicola]
MMNDGNTISISETKALILAIGKKLEDGEFGSFSPSIYDTAWMARIRLPGHDCQWLFPECFAYLLETQSPEGGWTPNLSEVDQILNTMASLVALKDHLVVAGLNGDATTSTHMGERIHAAEEFLELQLKQWDVISSVHVGTEILVPALLETLEKDGPIFEFQGRDQLMKWNQKKLRKFSPKMLYGSHSTTLVHSLESFVDKIDFDRVAHHLDKRGSMMASPAATAAYLMNATIWDKAAENYLRTVVKNSSCNGSGGVPGAFPSSIFELTWIMTTLLKDISSPNLLKLPAVLQIGAFLESQLDLHDGLVGFDSGLLEDVDDTAKSLLLLTLLGRTPSPRRMIEHFETTDHFRTYLYEANGSFSANCNVLDTLLHFASPSIYLSEIIKISQFLCREFDSGAISDKWNLSEAYSLMLLSQSFVKLFQCWDEGILGDLPQDLISEQMPIVLFQTMMRTLQTQQKNGSWIFRSVSREITAYSVLTLKALGSIPWFVQFGSQIHSAIHSGMAYLTANRNLWDEPEHIWVAKVTYALPSVSKAYMIAALSVNPLYEWTKKMQQLVNIPAEGVKHTARFFSTLPMFCKDESWLLEGDVALGCLYRSQLSRAISDIFPRRINVDNKYLEYIPFTWIATNRRQKHPLSNAVLRDMMLVSLHIYQLDEFMETLLSDSNPLVEHEDVRTILKSLCQFNPQDSKANGGNNTPEMNSEVGKETRGSLPLSQVEYYLHKFTSYLLKHPAVRESPDHVRRNLYSKFTQCMLAHIDYEQDNGCFMAQQQRQTPNQPPAVITFESAQKTYYEWVQETSAKSTQAPSTFLLFSCFVAPKGEPFFIGARQNYLAEALSQHLAALCRQYNDYGSVKRDKAEGNLNSLNFPEFDQVVDGVQQSPASRTRDETVMKDDLLYIAEYERGCLNTVSQKLQHEFLRSRGGDSKFKALKVFIETVDLYGQIYVARDISNRVR